MGHRRCHLVAVRDRLTARGLRRHGVRAVAPGNPMMDGFAPAPGALPGWLQGRRRLLLLPGSRLPEALGNLRGLLAALPAASATQPISLLLATGSRPSDAELAAPSARRASSQGRRRRTRVPRPSGGAARLSCWWGRAGLRPGRRWRSWDWPPPAPPPNSWWVWGCRPCRCRGQARSSRPASPAARAGSWGRCAALPWQQGAATAADRPARRRPRAGPAGPHRPATHGTVRRQRQVGGPDPGAAAAGVGG